MARKSNFAMRELNDNMDHNKLVFIWIRLAMFADEVKQLSSKQPRKKTLF